MSEEEFQGYDDGQQFPEEQQQSGAAGYEQQPAIPEPSAMVGGEPSPFGEGEPSPFGEGEPSPFGDAEPSPFGEGEAFAAGPGHTPEPVAQEPEPKKKKKKRKIDLKSRLSSVRAAGSMAGAPSAAATSSGGADPLAFPPPPAGSVPPPKVLSGGGGGGLLGALSSPFAPPEPEKKQTAAQQTIKVEVGEEIIAERKKAGRKAAIYAAVAFLVAAVAFFLIGKQRQSQLTGQKAVDGAAKLATEIDESNKVMIELSDALRKAIEKVQAEEFPAELSATLKKTNIPFSAVNLEGKGIGGLPTDVMRPLLAYANNCTDLNKKKDSLRNTLGLVKKPYESFLADKKAPKVRFAVVFGRNAGNMQAELVPIKKPFELKSKWPEKFTVLRLVGKKGKDVEATRWVKGDLTAETPPAIPVDQRTVATFTSTEMVRKFKAALASMRSEVDGRQSQNPDDETYGLIKDGERLVTALKKTAQAR